MSSEDTSEATFRKKPTKGYFVPSRYKQAAKAASQSSSREKSPQSRGHSPQKSEKSTLRSVNVEDSRYRSSKTSTPAIHGRHPLPAIDTSTITDEGGFLCVPKRNAKNAANSAGHEQTFIKNKTRSQTSKATGPLPSSQKTTSEFNSVNTLTTAELNILYAEYLQAKLLESSAKEAVQKRSKYISEKIHQIWTLMTELMFKNAKAYQHLLLVTSLIRLHNHLHTQEQILLPVLEMIPEFENQYESIAKAVDTVRHKLEIKNVSLPDTKSEEEVIELLHKISDTVKSMGNSDEIILGAGVSNTFLQQSKLVANEINRGTNLLSEANDLLLQETTLKLASPNEL